MSPPFWLVFFGDSPRGWWSLVTRRGYRHVLAAGYSPEAKVWIFYDPARTGTELLAYPSGEEVDAVLGVWTMAATAILRVAPKKARRMTPPMFGCVGAMKALLGVRCRALAPYGLYRHLRATGAEVVEVPSGATIGGEAAAA